MLWLALLAGIAAHPPGAYNPDVIQANIHQTICVTNWTDTVRPPSDYTDRLKRRQIEERGLRGRPADYEEDHFVPLALGGHPTDPANLWPQVWADARRKDVLERHLHDQVCAETLTLAEARKRIKRWEKYAPPLPKSGNPGASAPIAR